MIKKSFIILTIFTLLLFTQQLTATAMSTINISSTNNIHVAPDYTFNVDITLSAPTNLVGVQMKLLYDDSKFELKEILPGPMLTSKEFLINISTPGEIIIVYVDVLNKINSAGAVVLFTTTFATLDAIMFGTNQLLSYDQLYPHEYLTIDNAYNLSEASTINYNFNNITRAAKGDLDLSGTAGLADIAKIQLFLANKTTLSDLQMLLADVNGDQRISILDAARIQLFVAGLINSL